MKYRGDLSKLPVRKTVRLKLHDYSSSGAYFVTICADQRRMLFGEIQDARMILSRYGRIAEEEIEKTNQLRNVQQISIVKYTIMPNHIHMMIEIVGTRHAVSLHQSMAASLS